MNPKQLGDRHIGKPLEIEGHNRSRAARPQGLANELTSPFRWMKVIPKQVFIWILTQFVAHLPALHLSS